MTADISLEDIENYAVYYGQDRIPGLSEFDLVILQPFSHTQQEVHEIRQQNTLVFAYLSIGEAEEGRPWSQQVQEDWYLGTNPAWGSYYIDPGNPGWQHLLISEIIPSILEHAQYDGLFLDTLDTAEIPRFANTREDMIQLVQRINDEFPAIQLIQNRGMTLFRKTAAHVDAIMVEAFCTGYNFTTNEYTEHSPVPEVEAVQEIAQETETLVLTLDYTEDPLHAERPVQIAQEWGFIPYVSTIHLDRLYIPREINSEQ